ncbi:helix-turn-helix transcriptional regulator [Nocardia sp. NPDC051463]|uniref:helix-turn-helix domain-containing protein n=1 Tax=Nocardia sp. NPDC051463 TaxID=3154845 RepID=UPI00344DC81D
MSVDLGERLQSVRKRRGLNQRELAEASDVSLSLIRKIEQGDHYSVRLETLRKLAVGLRVRTSELQTGNDSEYADNDTVNLWESVRRALVGQTDSTPEEPATVEGVEDAFNVLRPMMGTHHYRAIAAQLPDLLRDADTLEEEGRTIRARLLGMTGWMLTQNRQFDIAEDTLTRAIDTATDHLDAAGAANTLAWAYLRQGRITEAERLAVYWADRIEPRMSRATTTELALWGRLWLYVANAAVRDNRPEYADDALRLAQSAAAAIGREVLSDPATVRAYGPVSVAHVCAETYVLTGKPDRALAIAARTPRNIIQPNGAGRLRHRLDVACAHTELSQFGEAMNVMQQLHTDAPEWLSQQRYARDIMGKIVLERRTLTAEMRELADAIRLEY